jgi:hypothetical protein
MTVIEELKFFIDSMNESLQDELEEINKIHDSKLHSAMLSGWAWTRETVDRVQNIYDKWK